MCLTLLQELKGRLYFIDYSYSNCVDSIILLNFVYLVFFFQYINIKAVTSFTFCTLSDMSPDI